MNCNHYFDSLGYCGYCYRHRNTLDDVDNFPITIEKDCEQK